MQRIPDIDTKVKEHSSGIPIVASRSSTLFGKPKLCRDFEMCFELRLEHMESLRTSTQYLGNYGLTGWNFASGVTSSLHAPSNAGV